MQFKDYGEEMVLGSMTGHMSTLHGRAAEERQSWAASPLSEEPRTYQMDFLTAGGPWRFTVEGCPERSATRMEILVNFMHLHVRDTVVILDKGNPPPTHGAPNATFWSPGML